MKTANNLPPSIRYFKARFKPLSRPMFWGSIGIFSLLAITIYQYLQHPDWLETTSQSTSDLEKLAEESQLSSEDLAVAVDIDNLDLLLKELEKQENLFLSLTNTYQTKKSRKKNKQNNIYNQIEVQAKTKLDEPLGATSTASKSQSNLLNNQLPSSNNNLLPNLIPNPIGRLYLSHREQLFNRTLAPREGLRDRISRRNNNFESLLTPSTTSVTATNQQQNNNNTITTPLVNSSPTTTNIQFNNPTVVNPHNLPQNQTESLYQSN
jgi:hypothetical protein